MGSVLPSILLEILETKEMEIEAGRDWISEQELISRIADMPPARNFSQPLKESTAAAPAVIAEIKKASPSAGVIRKLFDPASIAASYEEGGAACLSVLTDKDYFQGHRNYLKQARDACALPVLRKDFIIDSWQVYESRALEADCILLIAAALEPVRMEDLYGLAREIELDVLVEVHNEDELDTALELEDALIGVNNRDLHTFRTDLGVSERLKKLMPADRLVIAESGIRSHQDVERLQAAGINAFLIGEVFMRQPDPGLALKKLISG